MHTLLGAQPYIALLHIGLLWGISLAYSISHADDDAVVSTLG